ncbi:hypothetical protein DWR07_08710 [Staphylococcus aureus]|nr:hypothetical protein DWR07_08710 [Staphylococcus aureus]
MRGPNIEDFEKKFYRQCELGLGPIQKLMESQHTIIAGPQHRGFRKEILQTMQVGGRGPNIVAGGKAAYNNVQVGGAPT